MIKFKNMKKIINPKFLCALPLTGIGLLGTHQATHAMFQNPRLNMPLVKSANGKAIFLAKTYTGKNNPVSYIIQNGGESSIPKTKLQTPPSSPTAKNIPHSLMNLGDDLNNSTTSTNVGNIGNTLRNAGDRFNQ